ncbi:hypothetical protein [Alkalibacterium gilvum]|uniref:hypothetical protein n=1 Tax=Alkalibacterium gilvum TaxID=1130080 RepID=UPI003F90D051
MNKTEIAKLQAMLTDFYMVIESVEDKQKLLNAYDIINPIINKELEVAERNFRQLEVLT